MNNRLLLVEDDDTLRGVMQNYLEMNDYQVTSVSSANEGLASFLNDPLDIVVTDLTMPGDLNGVDVARRIKAYRPETKIIICTGHSEHLMRVKNIADKVLMKPFDLIDLIQCLKFD